MWFIDEPVDLLSAFSQQDLAEWIQDKEEVEVVDLILRIREKLVSCYNPYPK